jgi:DNA-binding transcriptional MerR regulator
MSSVVVKVSNAHDLPLFVNDDAADRSLLTISEMAEKFQTTLRTLRFYEARGLLSPMRKGMTRWYDVPSQRRFRLIDEGRKLGFTLSEIADLLGHGTTAEGLKLTIHKIKEQIAHLERQREDIDRALAELRRRYYVMTDPELE